MKKNMLLIYKEAQGLKGITGEGYFLGEKKLASY